MFVCERDICWYSRRWDLGQISTIVDIQTVLRKFEKFSVFAFVSPDKVPRDEGFEVQMPPEPLYTLLTGNDRRCKDFRERIRAYNSALSFVSFGAKLEVPGSAHVRRRFSM